MARIFTGLCNVGAWGCFDEFNRLPENILSAVSQQIQSIQQSMKMRVPLILNSVQVRLNRRVGLFITMNPGYAGRSELPENLKSLFRGVSMSVPDKTLIAEVLLYTKGFKKAEELSRKLVTFFNRCHEQLSDQAHYDFGLRALKCVIVASGMIKLSALTSQLSEEDAICDSLFRSVFPKFSAADYLVGNTYEILR